MMTSSNGSIFCVTGPLCGEFMSHQWIPLTKASDMELWYFLCAWTTGCVNNRDASDLRCHYIHYGVTVMWSECINSLSWQWWAWTLLRRINLQQFSTVCGTIWILGQVKVAPFPNSISFSTVLSYTIVTSRMIVPMLALQWSVWWNSSACTSCGWLLIIQVALTFMNHIWTKCTGFVGEIKLMWMFLLGISFGFNQYAVIYITTHLKLWPFYK